MKITEADSYILSYKSSEAILFSKSQVNFISLMALSSSESLTRIACIGDIAYLIFPTSIQVIDLQTRFTI